MRECVCVCVCVCVVIHTFYLTSVLDRAWVVNAKPQPLYPRKRNPVVIEYEVGWAPWPVCASAENLAAAIICTYIHVLYVYAYIYCIYVCMHACIYVRTYVCMYVYMYRFKIIEDPTCTCGKAVQTTDHLIFECETLTKEREKLKTTALKKDKWPINKKELIRKCYKEFVKFINDIPFDILTQNNNMD